MINAPKWLCRLDVLELSVSPTSKKMIPIRTLRKIVNPKRAPNAATSRFKFLNSLPNNSLVCSINPGGSAPRGLLFSSSALWLRRKWELLCLIVMPNASCPSCGSNGSPMLRSSAGKKPSLFNCVMSTDWATDMDRRGCKKQQNQKQYFSATFHWHLPTIIIQSAGL